MLPHQLTISTMLLHQLTIPIRLPHQLAISTMLLHQLTIPIRLPHQLAISTMLLHQLTIPIRLPHQLAISTMLLHQLTVSIKLPANVPNGSSGTDPLFLGRQQQKSRRQFVILAIFYASFDPPMIIYVCCYSQYHSREHGVCYAYILVECFGFSQVRTVLIDIDIGTVVDFQIKTD